MAQKKISELPIIETPSGSVIIPIVVDSTNSYTTANTNAISASALAFYVGQQISAAKTNATNTFVNTQTFNGAVFLNGDVNIVGNVVGGIRNEVNGLEGYTASLKGQTILSSSAQIAGNISGSFTNLSSSITNRLVIVENYISSDNSLLNIFSSSVNTTTSSLIGITNGLMAFTAALDNTYATDAQLLPILQATASLNTYTSSQNLVNLGISIVTGSINTYTSSQNLVNLGISIVTGSLNSQTSSQDLVNLGISIVTGSLNSQTGSQNSVNLGISVFTGSLRSEVNLIEAYTASLKGAIEVSGQNVNVLGMITAQQFNVTYVSSSTLYQSGSTKFGDTLDDRHEFTGSLDIRDSLVVQSGASGSFSGSFTGNGAGLTGVTAVSASHALNANTASFAPGIRVIGLIDNSDFDDVKILGLAGATVSQSNPGQAIVTIVTSSFATTASYAVTASVASDLYKPTGTISVGIGGDSNIIQISGSLIQLGNPTLYTETLVSRQLAVSGGITVHNTLGNGFYTVGVDNAGSAQIGANNFLNMLLKNDGRSILYNGVEVSASISVQNDVEAVNLIGSLLSTNGVVSSSTQISNYYKFAETASANTFYGNQTISGSLNVTGSVNIDNVIKLTPQHPLPSGEAGTLIVSSSYGVTNLYLFDGFDWKVMLTGSIQ